MKCDTTAINFPRKQLRDVIVGEVFSMGSPTGHLHTRIMPNIGECGFTVLFLQTNEFYTPQEQTMDEYVYILDAVVIIKMIER